MLNRPRSAFRQRLLSYRLWSHRRCTPHIITASHDLRYLIYPESAMDFEIAIKGIYDDCISTNLARLARPDGVVFDIGANVRLLTLPSPPIHVPQGSVAALKPDLE